MAQDSKRKRYVRRLKRERNVAMRFATQMMKERNFLGEALQKNIAQAIVEESKKPSFEIKRIEEPEEPTVPFVQVEGEVNPESELTTTMEAYTIKVEPNA